MDWIPVEERLPNDDDGRKQLVAFDEPFFGIMGKEIECACYDEDNGEWINEFTEKPILRVTHWMNLPASPKSNKTY